MAGHICWAHLLSLSNSNSSGGHQIGKPEPWEEPNLVYALYCVLILLETSNRHSLHRPEARLMEMTRMESRGVVVSAMLHSPNKGQAVGEK